jgi:PiT family inorganic phosphate transporter
MFGLSIGLTVLLILCLICVCAFEFINGFHDTANAVATVIYTKSLKPTVAVVISGILNGIGVFVGGTAVAMGIINMLPVETLVDQNIAHSIGMTAAILLTAIIWNLGTWYLGIPASSSHTLIGSILGVGIAYSFLPGTDGAAVNWHKVIDIGLSLLCSPVFGFAFAMLLMYLLKTMFAKNKSLFSEPDGETPPPLWIRAILVLTCCAVSFSHGSNDGQKGIGLMMLILIGIVPAYFALDGSKDLGQLPAAVAEIQQAVGAVETADLDSELQDTMTQLKADLARLSEMGATTSGFSTLEPEKRFEVRKEILLITNAAKKLDKATHHESASITSLLATTKGLTKYIEYAPWWVVVLIALSLGVGTMIGWKRIVVTIGEKIGKTHLSYAQGASAELVAASTIGVSTYLGLPVSTTHVLSSGIAGTMFARGGKDNLQSSTIKKILWAWVLTLPFCIVVSGLLFLLFRFLTG